MKTGEEVSQAFCGRAGDVYIGGVGGLWVKRVLVLWVFGCHCYTGHAAGRCCAEFGLSDGDVELVWAWTGWGG